MPGIGLPIKWIKATGKPSVLPDTVFLIWSDLVVSFLFTLSPQLYKILNGARSDCFTVPFSISHEEQTASSSVQLTWLPEQQGSKSSFNPMKAMGNPDFPFTWD